MVRGRCKEGTNGKVIVESSEKMYIRTTSRCVLLRILILKVHHWVTNLCVAGARKIWGTLQECTVKSVRNVRARLCNIDNSVQVRRKARAHPLTNKKQWWFVLHAHENVLVALEEKWASVKLQTSWKLEPCLKPVDTSIKTADSSSNNSDAT